MDEFAIRLLAWCKEKGDPYFDANDMGIDYDIHSPKFVQSFQWLVDQGYITHSKQWPDCGLEVGADGLTAWSVVDLHVTEEGEAALTA